MSFIDTLIADAFKDTKPRNRTADANSLVIWRGVCDQKTLPTLINHWGAFKWGMVECASSFEVVNNWTLPPDLYPLERVRLFDERGDFDVRRQRDQFHWVFIGTKNQWKQPANAESYIIKKPFLERPQQYVVWRSGDERTSLTLPDYGVFSAHQEGKTAPTYCLTQTHYIQSGRIAFVRYTGMEMKVTEDNDHGA